MMMLNASDARLPVRRRHHDHLGTRWAVLSTGWAMLEQRGARPAAAFLMESGASFRLTCRVLAKPTHRRASLHHSSKRTQQWVRP